MLERGLDYWHGARGIRGWLAGIVAGFSEGLQAIRTPLDLLIAVVYTVAHWGLVALAYFWIARAFPSAFVQSHVTFPRALLLLATPLLRSVFHLPHSGSTHQ